MSHAYYRNALFPKMEMSYRLLHLMVCEIVLMWLKLKILKRNLLPHPAEMLRQEVPVTSMQ